MSPRSEPFARHVMCVLAQNPDLVPPSLGLADVRAVIEVHQKQLAEVRLQ